MGHIQILRDFEDPTEGSRRTLRIFTPDAYAADRRRRFPVLYMHDGQNVFAHPESARPETWCANTILEQLTTDGSIEPWLIVAIDHGPNRFGDYSPWDFPQARVRGRGDSYAEFICQHVKPFVDSQYRTQSGPEWTATMGSSLGGLISLYLGWRFPGCFGRVGGLSPSVMWSDRRLFSEWRIHPRTRSRIYLDAGEHERIDVDGLNLDYGRSVRELGRHLTSLGYGNDEMNVVLEPGGQHHEIDWRRRLPFAMRWLLG